MARRGRAARISIEAALSMLDTSFSGSELDVPDSDPNSKSNLRQKNGEFESDVQHLKKATSKKQAQWQMVEVHPLQEMIIS